jgi:hypothetical protein
VFRGLRERLDQAIIGLAPPHHPVQRLEEGSPK